MNQSKTNVTSRCGLDCKKCPAYVATITNNDKLREKTADEWNKKYNTAGGLPITKNDINCLGCLSLNDPIYRHCKECGVRKCGVKKEVRNCGQCKEYKECLKISSLHKYIPEGKRVCDLINNKVS